MVSEVMDIVVDCVFVNVDIGMLKIVKIDIDFLCKMSIDGKFWIFNNFICKVNMIEVRK